MKIRLAAVLCLFISAALPAAARTPPAGTDTVSWIKNGETIPALPLTALNGQAYFTIDQLAGFSEAQIHWQSISHEACLSNSQGLLCFNWEKSDIERNGQLISGHYQLQFEKDQLLIPFAFITSKEFGSFSQSEITWNAHDKQLTVLPTINLRIPAVEKLSDRYRMSIETPGSLPHYLIEKSPERIWIRFVRARTEGSQILEGDSVVKEVRVVQRSHSADLMMKLGEDAVSNDVYFDDGKKKIIIDVLFSDRIAKGGTIPVMTAAIPVVNPVPAPHPVSHASASPKVKQIPVLRASPSNEAKLIPADTPGKNGIRTIVIDAGHGGMDSGAIGTRGTLEKELNLDVARALAKELEKNKSVRVVMTRDKDEFIPLSHRTEAANAAHADLFVSIHCNSSLSPKGTGFEVYYLSNDATDKAAASVARLENSVIALESQKGGGSSRLNQLLASMAIQNFMNESSKFATMVCRNVRNRSSQDKTSVKEADFYVLRGAQMPSVLVELEYLSNPVSELQLRSSRYRGQLVKGIVDSVSAYDHEIKKERDAVLTELHQPSTRAQR